MKKRGFFTFGFFLLLNFSVFASFDNKNLRHLSPVDIIQVINSRFPLPAPAQKNGDLINFELAQCQQINASNINILGVSSPLNGTPVQSEPQTAFIKWYFECLNMLSIKYFKLITDQSDLNALTSFLPADLMTKFHSFDEIKSTSWEKINKADREKIILFQLEQAIGPESILKDVKSVDTFTLKNSRLIKALGNKGKGSLLETLRWISVATMMQPESLRY